MFRFPRLPATSRFILVPALCLFAFAPGTAQAQFFGADWGDFDPGFVGGFDAGFSVAPAPDAPFNFGGFDDSGGGFSPYDNPHFGLGVYPNGVDSGIADAQESLNESGPMGANNYRGSSARPKLNRAPALKPQPKAKAKASPKETPKASTKGKEKAKEPEKKAKN